jgi:nitrite reductase/ring-hydroxylating ferredoxin subunit
MSWLRRSVKQPVLDNVADWLDAGGLDEFTNVRVVRRIGDRNIIVLRVRNDVYAVRDRCPHLGRTLRDARVHGRRLTCAAHGRSWSLPTASACSPRDKPLETYEATIVGDRVMVRASGLGGLADGCDALPTPSRGVPAHMK